MRTSLSTASSNGKERAHNINAQNADVGSILHVDVAYKAAVGDILSMDELVIRGNAKEYRRVGLLIVDSALWMRSSDVLARHRRLKEPLSAKLRRHPWSSLYDGLLRYSEVGRNWVQTSIRK